jgi:hypothetical protein
LGIAPEPVDPKYKASEDFFYMMLNDNEGWSKKTELK